MNVLVINGWSATESLWAGFFDSLETVTQVKVINLDHIASLEQWCLRIDAEVDSNTLLVGWSFGAALALKYAMSSGKPNEHIRGVICLMSNPCFVQREGWPYGMSAADFTVFSSLLESDKQEQFVKTFSHLMVSGAVDSRQERRSLKAHYSAEQLPPLSVLSATLTQFGMLDCREHVAALKVPCLQVFAANDALVPVLATEPGKGRFKGSPKDSSKVVQVVIPESGHLPFFQSKAAVLKSVSEFIGRHV